MRAAFALKQDSPRLRVSPLQAGLRPGGCAPRLRAVCWHEQPLAHPPSRDARLDQPIELSLFGRAALVLGFVDLPPEAAATQDVDGIIPSHLLAGPQANDVWWAALQGANDELAAEGLYLTHLFDEEQIILRADWLARAVDVPEPTMRFLRLRRPATVDLILTKMMRGSDPEDMQEVRFYLECKSTISVEELQGAFMAAVGPDVPEIRQLFEAAKPIVLAAAQELRSRP